MDPQKEGWRHEEENTTFLSWVALTLASLPVSGRSKLGGLRPAFSSSACCVEPYGGGGWNVGDISLR